MVIDLTWLSCGQNLAAEIEHFAKEVRKFDMTHIDNIEGRNAMDPPEDGCSPIFRQKFNLFMKDFYYFANGQIPVSGDQCKVQEKCLDYYSSQYPDSFDSCKFGTESATEIVNYMSHGCDLRGDSHQPGVTYFCPTKYTHKFCFLWIGFFDRNQWDSYARLG